MSKIPSGQFLVDYEIIEAIRAGELLIEGLDPDNEEDLLRVQPASLDIRLGDFGNPDSTPIERTRRTYTNAKGERVEAQGWWAEPGVLYLGSSTERFVLRPDYKLQLHGKSSIGRIGAVVHLTAGLIDPGFDGRIVFEIANLMLNNDHCGRDVWFDVNQPICQVEILKLKNSAAKPYGPSRGSSYAGQDGLRSSRLWDTHTRMRVSSV
jgi:dCTP deaminase